VAWRPRHKVHCTTSPMAVSVGRQQVLFVSRSVVLVTLVEIAKSDFRIEMYVIQNQSIISISISISIYVFVYIFVPLAPARTWW
jgi:hypothetical protein